MKTITTYAMAALLAASTSSMALAQATGATTDVGAGATAGASTDTDTGAGAGAGVAAGGSAGAETGAGAGAGTESATGTSAGTEAATGASAGTEAATGASAGTEAGTGASTGTDAASGAGATASGSSANTGGYDADHQRLITSITAASSLGEDYQARMEAVNAETTVEIVELSELRGTTGADTAMLDQALGDLEESREDMRSAVEGNEQVMQALEDEGFAAEDVVAIDFSTGIDNKVTLIVDAADS